MGAMPSDQLDAVVSRDPPIGARGRKGGGGGFHKQAQAAAALPAYRESSRGT